MAEPGDYVEVSQNKKIYKARIINTFRMFPSDLTGSLDDFFFNKLNREIEYGRDYCFY